MGQLKDERLLTRYRSDLSRIDTDIQAIVGLQVINKQLADHQLTYNRIKTAVSE